MTDDTDSGYAYRTTVQGLGAEESGPLDADNVDDAIAEYAQLWKATWGVSRRRHICRYVRRSNDN